MRRNKRKKPTKRRGSALGEVEVAVAESEQATADTPEFMFTAKEAALMLVTAIAAAGTVGAAIGRASLIVGIPVTIFGAHKRNPYIVAAGVGLALANGFQKPTSGITGVDGFDFKQATQDAKDRVRTFFENFKGKLYLPSSTQTVVSTQAATNGLGEGTEEQITYFVNPYGNQPNSNDMAALPELDMSAIDRIQEQIAEMSKPVASMPDSSTAGLNEIEREF